MILFRLEGTDRLEQWFNGDGNITAFTIKNGAVSFRQRYVRTEKFNREREAKRALVGLYTLRFSGQRGIANHIEQE